MQWMPVNTLANEQWKSDGILNGIESNSMAQGRFEAGYSYAMQLHF